MSWLQDAKDLGQAIQAYMTGAAIVAGAIWFYWRRERLPRARISHRIETVCISEGKRLVRITAEVHNIGTVLLSLHKGVAWVEQIKPEINPVDIPIERSTQTATVIEGARIGHITIDWDKEHIHQIEPGEIEEIPLDFHIDPAVEAISVYTYISNTAVTIKIKKWNQPTKQIGWSATSLFNIPKDLQGNTPSGHTQPGDSLPPRKTQACPTSRTSKINNRPQQKPTRGKP